MIRKNDPLWRPLKRDNARANRARNVLLALMNLETQLADEELVGRALIEKWMNHFRKMLEEERIKTARAK